MSPATKPTPAASEKRTKPWTALHHQLKKLRSGRRKVKVEEPVEPEIETLPETSAEKKHEQELEKGLESIFMDGENRADLSMLERRRTWRWAWMTGSFLALATLVMAGLYYGLAFFKPFSGYRGAGLKISVQGPSNVTLGKEEVFVFDWLNPDTVSQHQAELHLSFPQEFKIASVEPDFSASGTPAYVIGDVASGEHGSITVKGTFLGELGGISAVQALATFQPEGYQRSLETVAVQPLSFADTVLSGNLVMPPQVMSGDQVNLSYVVTNRGTQPLRNLVVRLGLPEGFIALQPKAADEQNNTREIYVPLNELPPGQFATVPLSGTFASGLSGDHIFQAAVGTMAEDGKYLAMQKMEGRLPLLGGDLSLQLVVNGADLDQTLDPGGVIRYSIGYANANPQALSGLVLKLGFETIIDGREATGTSLLDWSRLDDVAHGVTSTKPLVQTLTFGQEQVAELGMLPTGGEGTLEGGLPTLAAPSGTRDVAIKLSLVGLVSQVGTNKVDRVVVARPVILRYQSHADLKAEARYFTEEGAPVGSGPLPPTVNKPTTYRIYWHLTKAMHPLSDLTVTAVLPKVATWTGKALADQGDIVYNDQTRTVSWTLKEMPETTAELEASFEVELVPTTLDVGRFASLVGEGRLQAHDNLLDQGINLTRPALNTDLQNDEGAAGKGVVRQK